MALPNMIPQTKANRSSADGMVQKDDAEMCSIENWVSAEMLLICNDSKAWWSSDVKELNNINLSSLVSL